VIAARGSDFCTGADLKAAKEARAVGGNDRLPGDTAFIARQGPQRLITAVLDCDVPVVAAVNGTAAGLGMHLALACDLVVAADDARFIEVFVRRGLVPDGAGIWLLPRLVGMQRAKELMLLGDDLSADRAREFGLVNSVVPAADLEHTVRALATRLAEGPSVMLGLTKRLLNRSLESDRAVALDDEAEAVERARATADAQEGIDSFIERRPARFQGR
jgi:2-(1,2-epoxy-1,2-dihydrophenyl)acetyl-CoA isomerase